MGIYNSGGKIKKLIINFILVLWNVRILLDNEEWFERRIVFIFWELECYKIDIVVL